MNKIWHLNAISQPDKDGEYLVRLANKSDLLSVYHECRLRFLDGEWSLYTEYEDTVNNTIYVHSWRDI